MRIATVLVVEDEVLIRLSIAEHLRDHGFTVVEAATVEEARSVLLAGVTIDLVFSDINMPGGEDGLSLASWLMTHHPEIAVMLTSGVADQARSSASLAAIPFLDKPYDHDHVLHLIQDRLAKRPA